MLERDVKDAIWALDRVEKKNLEGNPDELARLLVQCTHTIRLHELKGKLSAGWGKYVYDKSISTLGENAERKLRNSRKEVLAKVLSLSDNEFNSLKESLREDIASLRVFDFEPETRSDFFKLINRTVSGDIKFFKASIAGPVPVTVLTADAGIMLISLDNLCLPDETAKEFDSETDAALFFSNFLTLVLHAKENGLVDSEAVLSDKLALKYVRETYKVFSRGIKDEKKMEIGELIREGNVAEALNSLLKHNSFYEAFKHLPNITLISFGKGLLKFTSFYCEGTFTINNYGLEKMMEAFEKNEKAPREFFIGASYLFCTLVDYFLDKRAYLSKELTPVLPKSTGWSLPLKISANCTVDSEEKENITTSIFGIKGLRIDTADGKFINITKADEDFRLKPVEHTLMNVQVYHLPEASDICRGTIYYSPEIFYLLNLMMVRRKLNKKLVDELNPRIPRKFTFVKEEGKAGIVSHFSDAVKVAAKTPVEIGGVKK